MKFSLGIITSLHPTPDEACRTIQEMGFSHIQLQYPVQFDSAEGIAAILEASQKYGLEITTVFCGFEGESYQDIPTVAATVGLVPISTRAERVKKTLEIAGFARKLGVARVGAHIGCVPEADGPERDELAKVVAQICGELAAHSQVFALETGQETANGLLEFLQLVNKPNLKVNFDPANMILYGNDQPIPATQKLFAYIDGVHCKDGCWPTQDGQLGEEKPWNQGNVDARRWVETLLQLGYIGPFTIEREISGEDQKRDIVVARRLLEEWLS